MLHGFSSKQLRSKKLVIALMAITIIITVAAYFSQMLWGRVCVEPSISIEKMNLEVVPLYGLLEVDLNVTANFKNPFNPEEVDVRAVFTSPSNRVITVPAFYYQEYNRGFTGGQEKLTPIGKPYWKVRFTPQETGEYKFHAELEDEGKTITTGELKFSVVSSDSHGFVRISNKDPRYFRFDDNSSRFFIGHDVCWFSSKGTYDYDEWFSSMSSNGETITRIWMAPWAFGIEWKKLGKYDMTEAWRLDYVLNKAKAKGIYVLLCLMNHGQLQAKEITAQWKDNPYNSANKGPIAKPEDFWTSKAAIDLFKKRLRYIVARWGYSTNILAWELWNEVELTDNYDFGTVAKWHTEMAQYIRQIDPYKHLITTSSDPKFGSLNSIDFLTVHRYGPTGFLDIGDAVHDMLSSLIQRYRKPVLLSEFGADWRWFGDSYTNKDTEGIQIHNGIWSSIHSGSASSAMLWWWDSYIHPNNLYHHFKALSRYLQGIKPDEAEFRPLEAKLIMPQNISVEDLCDVTVYPGLGWAKPETNQFTVDPYGNVPNVSQLSAYVQGRYHPELRNNPVFTVDFPFGGDAVIHVNSVANSGAVMKIYVDGSTARTVELEDRDGKNDGSANEYNLDVTVPVPVGKHTVAVDNAGNDWFTIDYVKFTDAALKIGRTRVIGLSNGTFALVWIQNKEHTWWNAVNGIPTETLRKVNIELLGFQNGKYTLEWWDTYTGETVKQETFDVTEGSIFVTVENLDKDISLKIEKLT